VLETEGLLVLESAAAPEPHADDDERGTVERATREQAARMGLVHPDDVDDELDDEEDDDELDLDLEDDD
jgi:hypothetical protein